MTSSTPQIRTGGLTGIALQPLLGLGLAIVLGPTKALVEIRFPSLPLDLGQILLAFTLFVWFVRGAIRRELRIELAWPIAAALAYTAVAAVSLLEASDLPAGLAELAKLIEIVWIAGFVLAECRAGRGAWIVSFVLLAGSVQALIGLWQFGLRGIGPEHFAIGDGRYRAYGTFEQPNPFGGSMGLSWPIAAGLAWALVTQRLSRRPAEHSPASAPNVPAASRTNGMLRQGTRLALLLASGAATFAAMAASFSRGAWLGATAALATLLLFAPRRRAFGLGLLAGLLSVGMLLAATSLLPPAVQARLADVADTARIVDVRGADIHDANFALIERLAHWQAALRMAEAHPWLGVGLGNYGAAYANYRLINWPLALDHAHNAYLNAFAETGVLGGLSYLALWALTIAITIRAVGRCAGWQRGLALGLLGTFVHLAVHQVVDSLLVNNVHLSVAAGLGMVAWLQERPTRN